MMNRSSLVDSFLRRCGPNGTTDIFRFLEEYPNISIAEKAEVCTFDQVRRWESGAGFNVEQYLEKLPDIAADEHGKLLLIAAEFRCRRDHGLNPSIEQFVARFADIADAVRQRLESEFQQTRGKLPATTSMDAAISLPDQSREITVAGTLPSGAESKGSPKRFGKYRVQGILGDGGFGRVYLAFDDELQRRVAVKVPHASRISAPGDVEAYLDEARILASLDHTGIVPVYDFGRTDDGRCFTVSKYIEGSDLATRIKNTPLTVTAAAELIAVVADALHYSHLRGIVHRDMKPANILIDLENRPYIADFGIALKEEDVGKDRPTVGTPSYMSPEQMRGEGHLVDGRSDVFSLGIVLYELLSGRRPFGRTRVDRRSSTEARPLRQINESIPQELDRICLKALAQRVAERYTTARDMSDDLQYFVKHAADTGAHRIAIPALSGSESRSSSDHPSGVNDLTIVPKGLRSFDREDAGFFLELLPGPRDRDGVPESVRFWKTQVTELDVERTFRVGLLYGPSGCGKSSFLKAGVLPQLPESVIKVYVESTPHETEIRLLHALRRQCPSLPLDLDLPGTLAALRRGRDMRAGTKVLVVLDQFEQWLHSRQEIEIGDLVLALRQCDGEHLQCIVAVRDDFWMAITHFMDALEVSLTPARNIAAIDLFSIRHARKVLTAMGRAYGAIAPGAQPVEPPQKAFVEEAVAELARNGLVIPVHLALFAEMVKDKTWTPAALKEIGGAAGVGVTFLEETFNSRTASPHHRLHQKAVRGVLAALVSEDSGDIKGGMRSYDDLHSVSGYQRQHDFDALLRILDSELRLITPTDPEGLITGPIERRTSSSEQFYHLTHDYLVPSIKEWLSSKQKETKRGRAELLLADRAQAWEAHPSSHTLPSFVEWLQILSLVPRRRLSGRSAEKTMLRNAARYHVSRTAVVALALVGVGWWLYDSNHRTEARSVVKSLQSASPLDVPGLIQRLEPVRSWADPMIREALTHTAPDSRAHLHLNLCYSNDDTEQQAYLVRQMLSADPDTLQVICDALAGRIDAADTVERLTTLLGETTQPSPMRFRAGVALAALESRFPAIADKWKSSVNFLAEELLREVADNPNQFSAWTKVLFPARAVFTPPLARLFSDPGQREALRDIAAAVLAQYVADQPELLITLLFDATPQQHRTLFTKLEAHSDEAQTLLQQWVDKSWAENVPQNERSQMRRKHSRAAVLLSAFGLPEPTLRALEQSADPEVKAFAEERLSSLALKPEVLLERLVSTSSPSLRAALLRTFGGIAETDVPTSLRPQCVAAFEKAFRTDPDSGVHSAAEWALRKWGKSTSLAPTDNSDKGWFVNRQGQTFVIVKAPGEFLIGSPSDEAGRESDDESRHKILIDRTFAIGTTEVTQEQYKRSRDDYRFYLNSRAPTLTCPATSINWVEAVQYCQWLCKVEEIPMEEWCYPADIPIEPGMELPANFLERTGYRLPTEGEWEFACRAGSAERYSFGADATLLHSYAWFTDNSFGRTWPVGEKKPNALGLFDMHGNAQEACHNIYWNDTKTIDKGDTKPLGQGTQTVSRGSSYNSHTHELRSANRRGDHPTQVANQAAGFRVARTIRRPTP